MTNKEKIRLITMFINLRCCKTLDTFSGDYLFTLEDGKNLLKYMNKTGIVDRRNNGRAKKKI